MSKHLTDSERLHIVEEYLGSPGASMPSRRSTTSPRGLLETIVRHFCDMTIGLFLRRTDVVLSRFGASRSLQFAPIDHGFFSDIKKKAIQNICSSSPSLLKLFISDAATYSSAALGVSSAGAASTTTSALLRLRERRVLVAFFAASPSIFSL